MLQSSGDIIGSVTALSTHIPKPACIAKWKNFCTTKCGWGCQAVGQFSRFNTIFTLYAVMFIGFIMRNLVTASIGQTFLGLFYVMIMLQVNAGLHDVSAATGSRYQKWSTVTDVAFCLSTFTGYCVVGPCFDYFGMDLTMTGFAAFTSLVAIAFFCLQCVSHLVELASKSPARAPAEL
mmetsp:Transcript_18014/g.49712  ORF Transcript_18014/g.49712 Transcript_18014/m.49712 type:complete len:178 (-) Transcript_18014:35-568(-)